MPEYGGNGGERHVGGDGCDTEAVSQPSGAGLGARLGALPAASVFGNVPRARVGVGMPHTASSAVLLRIGVGTGVEQGGDGLR